MHARQYLYLHRSLAIETTEVSIGTGKTLSAKICATAAGVPTAIGALSATATASAGVYRIVLARADLVSELSTMDRRSVWLHLDDGAVWHDAYEMVVTATAPELLPALL